MIGEKSGKSSLYRAALFFIFIAHLNVLAWHWPQQKEVVVSESRPMKIQIVNEDQTASVQQMQQNDESVDGAADNSPDRFFEDESYLNQEVQGCIIP